MNLTLEDRGKATTPKDSGALEQPAVTPSITKKVRVRLLIAFPLLIVLIISIVAGAFYQLVETEFGNPGLPGALTNRFASERMSTFARNWIIAMFLMDILGAVIGFAAAYSITEPIRKIIYLSQKVACGNFSERAAIERPDDLGALGHSFDDMVESLNRFIHTRNQFILESFTGGLITLDIHGSVTAINSAAEKMLGLEAGVAIGKPLQDLLNTRAFAPLLSLVEESLWKREPVVLRKLWLEDEDRKLAVCVHTSLLRDRSGQTFGIMVNLRDLEEWDRFYKQMARTDQLAALGTFAAGLTHEIRNPLGAIRGLALLMAEDENLSAKAQEYLRVILQETERLDKLVREIQNFSAGTITSLQPQDLNCVVRKAVFMARNNPNAQLAEDVELVEDYQASLPSVALAEDKFVQALMNILVNAFQATSAGGRIVIQTRLQKDARLPILITVENTGPQIPEAVRERVFEPFFTTKEQGTGLGLSIAYQIVKQHGGDLKIENTSEGVCVTIALPEAHSHTKMTG